MRNFVVTLCVALLWGATASAQDATQSLLDGLKGTDSSICKEYHFAVHMEGKLIGAVDLEIMPAKGEAAYRVTSKMAIVFGNFRSEKEGVEHLDEKLAMLSATNTETDKQGGSVKTKTSKRTKSGGKWTQKRTVGGKTYTTTGDATKPHHGGVGKIILMMKVDPTKPAKYAFSGMDWPKDDSQDPIKTTEIDLTVNGRKAPFKLDGKEIQAWTITVKEGFKTETWYVAKRGELLGISDKSMRMEAVSSSAMGKLGGGDAKAPAAGSPKAAVKTFYEVMARVKKPGALDGVVDWVALTDADPDLKGKADEFKTEFKKNLTEDEAPISPADIEAVMFVLTFKVDGDKATASLDKEVQFKLQKSGSGWKIVWFAH